MKPHPVNLLVALVVSALIAFALTRVEDNPIPVTLGIGAFVSLAASLGLAIGTSFADARAGVNARLTAMLFFLLMFGSNLIFAFAGFSQTAYMVTTGILFMSFVMLANAVASARQ